MTGVEPPQSAVLKAADSLSSGGKLPSARVSTMGHVLLRAARSKGGQQIRFLRPNGNETTLSYRELKVDASRVLTGLRRQGAEPGDKVVLHIDDEPTLLTGFWACLLGGLIPVPMGSGLLGGDPAQLRSLWHETDRVWLVTSHRKSDPVFDTDTDAGVTWAGHLERLRQAEPTEDFHLGSADDLAVLLLTSGSTGVPKAVMLSHTNVLSRCVAAVTKNGLTAKLRSFNWMPLNHVGGLIMFHFRDVYLRCTQVHARTSWIMADPLRWPATMSKYASTMTWAPNFAYALVNDRLADSGAQEWDLSPLVHIMNGGEAIKPSVLRRFLSLLEPYGLPPTAIYPGWGMSETSAGIIDSRYDPAVTDPDPRFITIGEPHPGITIRVVDEDDTIVPEGTTGLLQVSGKAITNGYYNNPELNEHTFTTDGWFRTGDLAYIADGALTVTGRADDVIVIGGADLHGHEIEAAVEELGVAEPSYTVASAVADDPDTETMAVFFHPRPDTDSRNATKRIRDLLRSRFDVPFCHVVTVAKADVPKTGIGKLRRLRLRHRFEAELLPRLRHGDRTESERDGELSWT